jgi:hypothetical protein
MPLTIDGQANSITSSTGGVNIPATVDTLSVGPSGSYMIANSSGVGIGTLTPQTTTHILGQNPVLKLQGTASTSGISGVELHANNNRWRIRADNNTSQNYFVIEDYAGGSNTNRLLIDSVGRVTTPYQPAFFASSSASSVATAAIIAYNSVAYNIGSHYDGTTNYRFTAPVSGIYHIGFMLRANNNNTVSGYGQLMLHINGAALVNGRYLGQSIYGTGVLNSQYASMCANTQLSLSAGDYVDIRNTNTAINFSGTESYFYGILLG